jgi:hypothetical protein
MFSELRLRIKNPLSYTNLENIELSEKDNGLFSLKRRRGSGKHITDVELIAKYNKYTKTYMFDDKKFLTKEELVEYALTI